MADIWIALYYFTKKPSPREYETVCYYKKWSSSGQIAQSSALICDAEDWNIVTRDNSCFDVRRLWVDSKFLNFPHFNSVALARQKVREIWLESAHNCRTSKHELSLVNEIQVSKVVTVAPGRPCMLEYNLRWIYMSNNNRNEKRDFDNDGILRTNVFLAAGFWDQRDYEDNTLSLRPRSLTKFLFSIKIKYSTRRFAPSVCQSYFQKCRIRNDYKDIRIRIS